MNNPVAHASSDPKGWKKKWLTNRKPQAMAHGAQGAEEVDLTVTHDVIDPDKFMEHVRDMKKMGKRKEMGAKNMPF
jgi:hypothetical protein